MLYETEVVKKVVTNGRQAIFFHKTNVQLRVIEYSEILVTCKHLTFRKDQVKLKMSMNIVLTLI